MRSTYAPLSAVPVHTAGPCSSERLQAMLTMPIGDDPVDSTDSQRLLWLVVLLRPYLLNGQTRLP